MHHCNSVKLEFICREKTVHDIFLNAMSESAEEWEKMLCTRD